MGVVFERQQMKLCNLPHPAGVSYAPTHIGIDYSSTPIMGARVWGVFSPYPGYNDDVENPCVVYAEDFEDYPTHFKAYKNNPIFEKPDTGEIDDLSFNADPDVLIDDDKNLHFINRPHYLRSSVGTVNMRCDYFKPVGTNSLTGFEPLRSLYQGTQIFASPSITQFNGKHRIYDLVTDAWNFTNGRCYRMRIFETDDLSTGAVNELQDGCILGYRIEPWHFSIFHHNGKMYSIVSAKKQGFSGADGGTIYLGEFDETGTNLFIYRKPLVDFVCYRSDAYVNENGLFVLYAAYFDGGDRQIYASAMDFEKLLKQIM